MIFRAAAGTGPPNEAVWQEHLLGRIIGLCNRPGLNMAFCLQPLENQFRKFPILRRVCGVVVIKGNIESCKILPMFISHLFDQRLGSDPLRAGLEHDRCAVSIFRADVVGLVTAHPLKTRPDVSLNVFNKMTEVNRTVGVR